ncbi:MAG: TDT family transporter [Tissierellia bacterium]|nr:TDT family transporter [Tissierellia bacterium]
MEKFKKVPIPISGLMLGLCGCGNLLASYFIGFKILFGLLSTLIGIFILMTIFADLDAFKKQMENPVIASVFATFPMALMILSTYILKLGILAKTLWYIAFILHIILIIYFTIFHILRLDIKKVYAGYFIVYVGIVVASMTSKAFDLNNIGKKAFYFGLISYILLLILVSYRYITLRDIDDSLKPLFAIYAAPGSLLVVGYVSAFEQINMLFLSMLLIISQLIFFMVILKVFKLFRGRFYPSFSAFTFPFIITATALKLSNAFVYKSNGLFILANVEIVFSVIVLVYVFLKYMKFIRK